MNHAGKLSFDELAVSPSLPQIAPITRIHVAAVSVSPVSLGFERFATPAVP